MSKAKLSPRDLYFATHHQAAHVAVAMVLGCRIDGIETSTGPDAILWSLDAVPTGDLATVCAAGYAMELLLGRRAELAEGHCRDDRSLMARLMADRTGFTPDSASVGAAFLEGAEQCRAILAHAAVRSAIDRLADAIAEAHLSGELALTRNELNGAVSSLAAATA